MVGTPFYASVPGTGSAASTTGKADTPAITDRTSIARMKTIDIRIELISNSQAYKLPILTNPNNHPHRKSADVVSQSLKTHTTPTHEAAATTA
jgi:nickel-dependent lactate racemase